MTKTLIFLIGPLASLGLVLVFGLPVLIGCAALALISLLISTGEADKPVGVQIEGSARQQVTGSSI